MKKFIKKPAKIIEEPLSEAEQKMLWVKNFEKPLINHYIENGKILDEPFVFMVLPRSKIKTEIDVFPVTLSGAKESDQAIYETFSEKLKAYLKEEDLKKDDGKIIVIHHSEGEEDFVFLIREDETKSSSVTQIDL